MFHLNKFLRFSCSLLAVVSMASTDTLLANVADGSPKIELRPVPFTDVKLSGGFWGPRIETNRTVSLPHSLQMLEKAGNIKDLELAAAGTRTGYMGPVFIDSDLYKALEAVSYSLASHPDAELEKKLDEIIAKIAAAQEDDGYLNTHFQVVEPEKRWTNLRDKHELYCAGHLIEAAVAHHQATGKRTLLDVAIKFADYIDSVFGSAPGKRMGYPGHEEIELALFKLWRLTGEKRYYDLAAFFLESRGQGFFAKEHDTPLEEYDGKYWQDDAPLRDYPKIAGHAVRAVYLLSGATDYAAVSKDKRLLQMLDRVWNNTTGANMYVTGGIGSSAKNEGFTFDYDLPNFTGYQETCASVAMIMWNHRLGLLSGNSKYADHLERALYNGFLSGVALDGKKFFYVNPLASHGAHHRKDWYSCACCPPNVTRTLSQLGGYAYATSPGALWVNLYMQGSLNTKVPVPDHLKTSAGKEAQEVSMDVTTDYPWDGKVDFKFNKAIDSPFTLRLRLPDWCTSASVNVDGEPAKGLVGVNNGYFMLDGPRAEGEVVSLVLDMPVARVAANPKVKQNVGRLAIRRGPVVYCLEEADNDVPVHQVALSETAELKAEHKPDLLGGVTVITGEGELATTESVRQLNQLYAPLDNVVKTSITAIPYYVWDNRTAGDMAVWLPTTPEMPQFKSIEALADVSMSFISSNCDPNGARDGIEPQKSSDKPLDNCHWWPHKGTEEWLQYEWSTPQLLTSSRVYWFDDTGHGECRIPEDWRLEYRNADGDWKPISTTDKYGIELDKINDVHFKPTRTDALRLVVKMQNDFAAGVHEWQVSAD